MLNNPHKSPLSWSLSVQQNVTTGNPCYRFAIYVRHAVRCDRDVTPSGSLPARQNASHPEPPRPTKPAASTATASQRHTSVTHESIFTNPRACALFKLSGTAQEAEAFSPNRLRPVGHTTKAVRPLCAPVPTHRITERLTACGIAKSIALAAARGQSPGRPGSRSGRRARRARTRDSGLSAAGRGQVGLGNQRIRLHASSCAVRRTRYRGSQSSAASSNHPHSLTEQHPVGRQWCGCSLRLGPREDAPVAVLQEDLCIFQARYPTV